MRMVTKNVLADAESLGWVACRMGPFRSVGERIGKERGRRVTPIRAHCPQTVLGPRRVTDPVMCLLSQLGPADPES